MAQGTPPPNSYAEMPPGLWIVPRWLGIETLPALFLVLVELFGILARSGPALIISTVLVALWYWVFRQAFARDEQMIALLVRNRHFLRLTAMRDDALVSSRVEHLERIF